MYMYSCLIGGKLCLKILHSSNGNSFEGMQKLVVFYTMNFLIFPTTFALISLVFSMFGIQFKSFKNDYENYRLSDFYSSLHAKGYKRFGNSYHYVSNSPIGKTINFQSIKTDWIAFKIFFKFMGILAIFSASFLIGPLIYLAWLFYYKKVAEA